MKSSQGTVYVLVVLAGLAGYFIYQSWFNPNRIIKQRLGDVAGALSAPASEDDLVRLARLAKLRGYVDERVHVRIGRTGPEVSTRDEAIGAAAGWKAPNGVNIDFLNVDVRVNADDTARAFATAEVTTKDLQNGQQTIDSREVVFALVKRDGGWLISDVDVKDAPATQ